MMPPIVEIAEATLRQGRGIANLAHAVGNAIPRAFMAVMRYSDEAAETLERFAAASNRVSVSVDATSVAAFRKEASALEDIAKNLNAAERDELLAEIQKRRASIQSLESPAADAPQAITRPKAGTRLFNELRSDEAARFQRDAGERLRTAAMDRSSPTAIARSNAIDRISGVVGAAQTDGWSPVFEYLAENSAAIARAERQYADALSQVAVANTPAAQAALEAATSARRGFHSKLKGILGEAYASRCPEWLDLRDAFFELATRRVADLNVQARRMKVPGRWEVLHVKGTARIGGLEAWDEAVLIVEKLRPGMKMPRAELVMAAQYKVEKRVSALRQIENDVARETGGSTPALFSHSVESGAVRTYQLIPGGPTNRPTRFLFNAEGGTLSQAQVQRFAKGNVSAQQGRLFASVDDFGMFADELLASAAKTAGQ